MSADIISHWKKIKRSGAFRRKIKQCFKNILQNKSDSGHSLVVQGSINHNNGDCGVSNSASFDLDEQVQASANGSLEEIRDKSSDDEVVRDNWFVELESREQDDVLELVVDKNADFRKELRSWAVSFNIAHSALKVLFENLNNRIPNIVPQDPRTLLKTYQTVIMTKVGHGDYWHHGFEFCSKQILTHEPNCPDRISLNVNIDGLPIYRSSRNEFWPILFNIKELPEMKPMVIGIYCGKGKPSDLSAYLEPFVQEAKIIFSGGLIINGKTINVKLRCFICDSPARAFIKGKENCSVCVEH